MRMNVGEIGHWGRQRIERLQRVKDGEEKQWGRRHLSMLGRREVDH